jgi:hypothetical protein
MILNYLNDFRTFSKVDLLNTSFERRVVSCGRRDMTMLTVAYHIFRTHLRINRQSVPYRTAYCQAHTEISGIILCKAVTYRQIHVNDTPYKPTTLTSVYISGIISGQFRKLYHHFPQYLFLDFVLNFRAGTKV